MRKRGLVSVSFRSKTPKEIVSAMQKCGLSYIEWGSDVHAPQTDKARLEEIRKLCTESGICVSSYGTYFKIGANKTAELEEYIKAAKLLGTNILRLWCGTKGYAEYSPEEFKSLICECSKIAQAAEKNGVKVCMECHNNTVTDCAEGALALMRGVNSESFGMYWQPNQYKTEEENLNYARIIAPYTEIIHVFNWSGEEKYPLKGAEEIWKKYLACFADDIPLLLEFMPDGKIESLETEARALLGIAENTI